MYLGKMVKSLDLRLLFAPTFFAVLAFALGWLLEGILAGVGFGVGAWGAALSTANYLAEQRAKRPHLDIQLWIARELHEAPKTEEEGKSAKSESVIVKHRTPLSEAWQFLRSSAGAVLLVDITNRGDSTVRLTEWGVNLPGNRLLRVPWDEEVRIVGPSLPLVLEPGDQFTQYLDWKTWMRKLRAMEYEGEVEVRVYCQDHKRQIYEGDRERIPARVG